MQDLHCIFEKRIHIINNNLITATFLLNACYNSSNFTRVLMKLFRGNSIKSVKSFMWEQTREVNGLLRACVCVLAVYYTLTKSLFPEARSLGGRLEWRTRLFRPADSLDLLFAPMRWCGLTSYIHGRVTLEPVAIDGGGPLFSLSPISYKAKLPRNAVA